MDVENIPRPAIFVSIYHVALLIFAGATILVLKFDPVFDSAPYCNAIIGCAFGMLGGTLHASRYVIRAVRMGKYDARRILWQVVTPIHAAVFGVVAIVLMKSGLHLAIDNNVQLASSTRYQEFIMVVSFLAGFTTEIFIKKLTSASESFFGEKNLDGEV